MTSKTSSPLRYCLKSLEEGLEPGDSLEFVADWGPEHVKSVFRDYVKLLKQGRPLTEILEQIRLDFPSVETELFIASMEARLETGRYPAIAHHLADDLVSQQEQAILDINLVVGSARRWTVGLIWAGILGGAFLLVCVPRYSQSLLSTPCGRTILGIAATLEVVGLFWTGALWGRQNLLEVQVSR